MFQSNKQHAELARPCNYICSQPNHNIFLPTDCNCHFRVIKKNWSSYHTAYPIFTSVWVFQNWILITYFFGYLTVLLHCWSWQLFFKVSHTFYKKCCTNMLLSKLIQCNCIHYSFGESGWKDNVVNVKLAGRCWVTTFNFLKK